MNLHTDSFNLQAFPCSVLNNVKHLLDISDPKICLYDSGSHPRFLACQPMSAQHNLVEGTCPYAVVSTVAARWNLAEKGILVMLYPEENPTDSMDFKAAGALYCSHSQSQALKPVCVGICKILSVPMLFPYLTAKRRERLNFLQSNPTIKFHSKTFSVWNDLQALAAAV